MRVIAGGINHKLGYKKYSKLLIQNNDFHNNTDCITLMAIHQSYLKTEVKNSGSNTKRDGKCWKRTGSVLDVNETKTVKGKVNTLCQLINPKRPKLKLQLEVLSNHY